VQRGHFIERNRLIAALSAATVVVEAAERSGALSTARVARRLGRPLLAVPGDIDRPQSRGCHALLRAGALPLESAGDVMRALAGDLPAAGRGRRRRTSAAPAPPVAASLARSSRVSDVAAGADRAPLARPPAARLLAALDARPASLETLAEVAQLAVPEALAALLELEWGGVAVALPGQRWARRAEPAA
jgi:DNA processing protein